MFTRRYAYFAFAAVAAAALLLCGYYGTLPIAIRTSVYSSSLGIAMPPGVAANLSAPTSRVYRFDNGRVMVTNSRYSLAPGAIAGLDAAKLESLYENVVLETTADCSTSRRFGRREDGGWDLCLVGPYTPQEPCFSFSFGVNNIWEFDEEVASQFKCQVFAFDPTMSQENHMHSDRVMFLKEGLHASMGTTNSWMVDSYLGFLKRFNAESLVIDILKMDIEFSEWPALETAVRDGSLRNVKQLLIESHVDRGSSVEQYLSYFSVLRSLHELGFRLWHHNWNIFGNYASQRHPNTHRTCCHELYYVNINFLEGGRQARNPPGSRASSSVKDAPPIGIAKTPGFDQLAAIRRANLTTLPGARLEALYFKIVEQQHLSCPSSVRIGDTSDGGWDVCFAGPYDIRKSQPSCVAFSFGINNVWGYDDELAEKYHCRVYMFDPSMTSVGDHQRKKTSWFYRIGLSSENRVASNGWTMRTLCSLFEEMGYAGKTVDILKVDIEYWEWVSFEKALQDGCLKQVKQLMFESHTAELVQQRTDYARLIRVWLGLFDLGFRTWKWHKNPYSVFYKGESGLKRACCYEHYMLNTNLTAL